MRQSDIDAIKVIGFVCLFTLAVHLINVFLKGQLNDYGLLPRHFSHFTGIIAFPFLHGSWGHLFSNLVSFAVLSYLLSRSGLARFMAIFLISWIGSGIGVWVFGRMHYHIGLSGIIYGLWTYLLIYAIMYRSLKSIAIALIVMFLYGSMVWGFIPAHAWVSYESHFFGALAGAIAGFYYARRDKARDQFA
ncbi:rhomboid family intramembrane serine protease [Photobacterium atrarenae]|uniref:Rhomboid family intramembrane serine protease n=1 Tax=Photobacterium atrarenae TaxID=865757 RepID=A0ABY5GNW3_9GAMM|nr:rhomboid family intramembrane serine protease [Photobacterium atrarenae]UTV29983.1 rhomboid family intramembrane serine protease [Photobacterium atrarenae]